MCIPFCVIRVDCWTCNEREYIEALKALSQTRCVVSSIVVLAEPYVIQATGGD